MNTLILVQQRNNYGAPAIYPMNEQAKLLAQIAGTKTLTHAALQAAQRMGFTVQCVPVEAPFPMAAA